MSQTPEGNGASTALQVEVPKTLYDELASTLSPPEINRVMVECLRESLRKVRFQRDLERTQRRNR